MCALATKCLEISALEIPARRADSSATRGRCRHPVNHVASAPPPVDFQPHSRPNGGMTYGRDPRAPPRTNPGVGDDVPLARPKVEHFAECFIPMTRGSPSPMASGRSVHRYYDPATGQFLSMDPLVTITGAPYFYAGDNPVNGSDPTGLGAGGTNPACTGNGPIGASPAQDRQLCAAVKQTFQDEEAPLQSSGVHAADEANLEPLELHHRKSGRQSSRCCRHSQRST